MNLCDNEAIAASEKKKCLILILYVIILAIMSKSLF